jgi:hypothetical protein
MVSCRVMVWPINPVAPVMATVCVMRAASPYLVTGLGYARYTFSRHGGFPRDTGEMIQTKK